MKNLILYFSVVLFFGLGCTIKRFKDEFEKLPHKGVFVPIHGTMQIDQTGGHLQGIQWYQDGSKNYLFLSGSSSEVAFMVRAELDDRQARIVSSDTLSLAPFRHAGGFQIYGQYLAVGIEDNKLRNTSRIVVYDLEKGEDMWSEPLHTIHRNGDFERVTAGAVGMTEFDKHILIAVANWDSRNLDFYVCARDEFVSGVEGFRLIGSLEMAGVSRNNWSDSIWYSYQNINLFTESNNRLYLVGFATNESGDNVADLYQLEINGVFMDKNHTGDRKAEIISLRKITSRTSQSIENTSFRSGGGLFRNQEGELTLIACPEHMNQNSSVGLYSKINPNF